MLAKMPCLIRRRMTSLGVVCIRSARSLTIIFGGIAIGPVGFSFTAAILRSCGRCTGVAGRVGGRAVVGCACPPGRAVPGWAGRMVPVGRPGPVDVVVLLGLAPIGRPWVGVAGAPLDVVTRCCGVVDGCLGVATVPLAR